MATLQGDTRDFPAWPVRPHSAFRNTGKPSSGKPASGFALPPRPRSALLPGYAAGAGRPRLRLGGGRAPIVASTGSKGAVRQALGHASPGSASGPLPPACCERVRSTSIASASTRDTDPGSAASLALHSSVSLAPSADSIEGGVEFFFNGGVSAAARNLVATVDSMAAALEPVATAQAVLRVQAAELETAMSPAALAADDEWAARQRAPPPRPPSAPSVRSPDARPSSAHALRRLPLSSIAFAAQARSNLGAPIASQGSSELPGAAHVQAVQVAAAVSRSSSTSALHRRPPSELVGGRYRLLNYLGRGTSATVWDATDAGKGDTVAIKVFDKKTKGNWAPRQKQAVREARLLQMLSHPAIIKVHETFDAPLKFHIVMELVVGGSLRELLRQQPSPGLGEVMSRGLFEQTCQGVQYCHERNVVHRDLKLENVLLESATGCAKIIDFGFALQLRSPDQRLKVFCGTPSYMAPELVMGKEYSGFSTDMWAIGVLLYGMLTGRLPFEGYTESQLYAKIRRGSFRLPDGVSDYSRRVVSGLLRIDAPSRPTAAQVLQHPWADSTPTWGIPPNGAASPDAPARARPSSVPASVRRLRTAHT